MKSFKKQPFFTLPFSLLAIWISLCIEWPFFDMKLLPLSQGQFAMVDDADYDWLNQWKWYARKGKRDHTFYATRNLYEAGNRVPKAVNMHRLILGICGTKLEGDHIDHNGLNNQRNNLRVATRTQNVKNKSASCNGTSKYLGVSFKTREQLWVAQIYSNGKKCWIGQFENEIDAAKAYNAEAIKHHGEFANLNII